MTILPRASSRQRPPANFLANELASCTLNQIFFPGYTVVASVRTPESLTLKLEATSLRFAPSAASPALRSTTPDTAWSEMPHFPALRWFSFSCQFDESDANEGVVVPKPSLG